MPSTRSRVAGGSSPKRSESAMNGQSWASCCAHGVASPPKPARVEHPLLEVAHPGDHRGVGEVVGVDGDLDLARDAGRLLRARRRSGARAGRCGHELADVGDHLGPGADDPAGDGEHERRRRAPGPGAATDIASARRPIAREPRPTAALARRATAREPPRGRRGRRRPAPRRRATPPGAARAAREPGGEREHEGDRDPGDQQEPEAADHRDRREQQDEEAGRRRQRGGARSPGRPRAAASTAARGGEEPASRASTKRAWNWIA